MPDENDPLRGGGPPPPQIIDDNNFADDLLFQKDSLGLFSDGFFNAEHYGPTGATGHIGVTGTTVGSGGTGAQPQQQCNRPSLEDQIKRINTIISGYNQIIESWESIPITEYEINYYNRKVQHLLQTLSFLVIASQNAAQAAQYLQNTGQFSKGKQVELAIDTSYEMMKEAACVLETTRKRIHTYLSIVEKDINTCDNFDIENFGMGSGFGDKCYNKKNK